MSYQELANQVRERRNECEHIALILKRKGFDVDWQRVNRSYVLFKRYHNGLMSLGYLISQTGIRHKSLTTQEYLRREYEDHD